MRKERQAYVMLPGNYLTYFWYTEGKTGLCYASR